jgi:hypothetical protein
LSVPIRIGHRSRATSAATIGWQSNFSVDQGLSVASAEPYALLCSWFTEDFDTLDLKGAKTRLEHVRTEH